jgi:hypothetical protein
MTPTNNMDVSERVGQRQVENQIVFVELGIFWVCPNDPYYLHRLLDAQLAEGVNDLLHTFLFQESDLDGCFWDTPPHYIALYLTSFGVVSVSSRDPVFFNKRFGLS